MGVVGIIPAAGKAERIDGLPKYLLPTGDSFLLGELCRKMTFAGADQLLIGANPANRALVEQYAPDNSLVYGVNSRNMSETVLAARNWAADRQVLFGMPDTWWSGGMGLYPTMLNVLAKGAQVAVAVWHVVPSQTTKLGMVEIARAKAPGWEAEVSVITDIEDKPAKTKKHSAWGAIAWAPAFWEHINADDPHIGYALQRAMARGVTVHAVPMWNSEYYDCGTREEYFSFVRALR